jgi:hypothetical protein
MVQEMIPWKGLVIRTLGFSLVNYYFAAKRAITSSHNGYFRGYEASRF